MAKSLDDLIPPTIPQTSSANALKGQVISTPSGGSTTGTTTKSLDDTPTTTEPDSRLSQILAKGTQVYGKAGANGVQNITADDPGGGTKMYGFWDADPTLGNALTEDDIRGNIDYYADKFGITQSPGTVAPVDPPLRS